MAVPVIVVHGGCGALESDPTVREQFQGGAEKAAKAGWEVLQGKRTALDAVEVAVRILEDEPLFNAGRGSVLTSEGQLEMDAAIMDGTNLKAGSVAGISTVANPISLARKVMEKTDHVMIAYSGAERFASKVGMPTVSEADFITERSKSKLSAAKGTFSEGVQQTLVTEVEGYGTVGAVAVDSEGNIAAATSTGGITGQLPGRVGDTPIVGSGVYADNSVGAASATGHGESIMKMTLSRLALWLIEQGKSPQEAADEAVKQMGRRVNGLGGLILVDKNGQIGIQTSTKLITWASYNQADGLKSGLEA
jgi:beta-aspartyl-peptidase (threonine type)